MAWLNADHASPVHLPGAGDCARPSATRRFQEIPMYQKLLLPILCTMMGLSLARPAAPQ